MEQELFENYFDSKLSQLETLVKKYPDDAVILDVKLEKFDKHDAYDVEIIFRLPAHKIKANEASHTIMKAVDLAKDRLISQLKKQKDQKKNEQLYARRHASIRKPEVHEKIPVEEFEMQEQ
jgi:ribosomal subunit interface protein